MSIPHVMDALSKIAVALVTAAVLGTFAFAFRISQDITEINKIHARMEEADEHSREERFEMRQQIEDLEHDVRALMIAVAQPPRSGATAFVPGEDMTREQQNRLDEIADAIRRQNCFLAGGRGPACQGITP